MNHSSLHSVFQTNQSNNQQSNFEAVQSGKKKKKQKMVRADPSLLGEFWNAKLESNCPNTLFINAIHILCSVKAASFMMY